MRGEGDTPSPISHLPMNTCYLLPPQTRSHHHSQTLVKFYLEHPTSYRHSPFSSKSKSIELCQVPVSIVLQNSSQGKVKVSSLCDQLYLFYLVALRNLCTLLRPVKLGLLFCTSDLYEGRWWLSLGLKSQQTWKGCTPTPQDDYWGNRVKVNAAVDCFPM